MELNQNLVYGQLQITANTAKTFVFDLDGTIIYDGKPLAPDFEKYLLEIKAAGHQIIFATGRSWRDFIPVVPEWCSSQPSVVFGGGLVVLDGAVKAQEFLNPAYLEQIIRFLEDQHIDYLVDGHSAYYHPAKEHWLYQDILELTGQHKAHNLDVVLPDGVYKILVLDAKCLEYFREFIVGKDLSIKFHFYDQCFDIMPSHVNKFAGLSQLQLPAKEDIYVFGNDHNDLELFQELPNSIMFGHHQELMNYAKLRIDYADDILANFAMVVNTILLRKC